MNDILKPLEELYTNGKFTEGIELLKANEASLDPSVFHYNLGTFYLKNSQTVLSRYHLEVAKNLNFDPNMVNNNIAYIKEKLGLERVEIVQDPIGSLQVNMDSVSQVYFDTFLLVSLCFSIFVYRKRKSTLGAIFFLLLGLIPFVFKKGTSEQFSKAIVMKTTELKEGPSEAFESTGDIPEGIKVYLTHQRNKKWFYLKYPKAFSGWVSGDRLKFIR